ncbi:helix-turn-helix transcriptional regulator [Xenorhabdus sp. DI]|uniref:helix-turn-helix transcriptional regulator n=1 Tax=Xenorhabdus doucetiae TaxID=351671 RepID=UPI00198DC85B|nr:MULTISPECIES: AraC family transcriptional regulator [unclassified Xenorhabdus]MBD2784603.1 helix-turn-helix transcriptional regulator [Xenorhabdus sp. 3]MBD2788300.1 helix-turn-helix transcriptional regulator [Xenorhabdus sp. DI]
MLSNVLTTPKFIQQYKHATSELNFLYNISTEWHQHPCIQLSLSLHRHELLTLSVQNEAHSTHGFLIRSNVVHKLDSSNTCSITLLIEPIDEHYHLFSHLTEGLAVILLEHADIVAITDYLVKSFLCGEKPDTFTVYLLLRPYLPCHCQFDKRILKAVSFIESLSVKRISSRQVADKIYLSESRFLHLFRDQLGINFRAYLLWLRLSDAIGEIHMTDSLTLIANNCGFSDTAHFSRTCKMAYGIRPSDLKHIIQQNLQFNCEVSQCLYNTNKQNIHGITQGQFPHEKEVNSQVM